MKKRIAAVLSTTAATLLLTGCLVAPVVPPYGIVYTEYKAPLDYDQEESDVGTRSGQSESISILGLVALGDASVKTAAENGGLTTIHGADYEYFNVLGVYQRYRTILHGE